MKNELLKGLVRTVLFIWELPQTLLGFILSRWYGMSMTDMLQYKWSWVTFSKKMPTGISLGHFIILNSGYEERAAKNPEKSYDINHEYGHTIQSMILGPLYLIVIGLPSLLGNIWDRLFHKKWDYVAGHLWYYNLPWEKWADKLGKVVRIVRTNGTLYQYVRK